MKITKKDVEEAGFEKPRTGIIVIILIIMILTASAIYYYFMIDAPKRAVSQFQSSAQSWLKDQETLLNTLSKKHAEDYSAKVSFISQISNLCKTDIEAVKIFKSAYPNTTNYTTSCGESCIITIDDNIFTIRRPKYDWSNLYTYNSTFDDCIKKNIPPALLEQELLKTNPYEIKKEIIAWAKIQINGKEQGCEKSGKIISTMKAVNTLYSYVNIGHEQYREQMNRSIYPVIINLNNSLDIAKISDQVRANISYANNKIYFSITQQFIEIKNEDIITLGSPLLQESLDCQTIDLSSIFVSSYINEKYQQFIGQYSAKNYQKIDSSVILLLGAIESI
ncbi:MAG: hypothetical protein J4473_01180 [Candidatus Aenigmarchaeota archaeon]|nr:hypothetical protein [Candidatus Aenigmarchaeota archaeon]